MEKILCISDSLGLSRPGVYYSHTWISMLKERMPDKDFIPLFRRSGTTDMLSDWDYGEFLSFYNPEEVILQLGICDCSPRYMRTTSLVYRVMNKMPGIIQKIFWKIYKLFVKRTVNRTDVPASRFRENIENYLGHCLKNGVKRVIILKIAQPGPKMVNANPLVVQTIAQFNEIYDDISRKWQFVTLIDPLNIPEDTYYVDGYHANQAGNGRVAGELEDLLKKA